MAIDTHTGRVSGTLTGNTATPFAGTYSFVVNLDTGVIANGVLEGKGTYGSNPVTANLSQGIGEVTGGTFLIKEWKGEVTWSGGTTNEALLGGTSNLLSMKSGDSVENVTYNIYNDTTHGISVSNGTGTGTFEK